ncbi:MAG: hypothetical protein LBK65_09975 [Tannerellaceae bacterium]|jgi:hypothetical protein|nr:hypothetical protein [Tannerellaceae bacterium]
MKYLGYFLAAMLIAISACTKVVNVVETDDADGDETAGDVRISFVLPQADNVVTYTAASAEEGGSASDDVVIYAFSPSLRFVQRYAIPYSGGTPVAGGGRQYSITMRGSGKHNFVFLQAPASYPFPELSAGSSLGALTAVLTPTVNGRLSPPFVMSNTPTNGKPYITVESIENQTAPIQVSMKSRVARIDLDYNDSGHTILGVDISNAATAGRMLDSDYAPAAPSSGGVTYSLSPSDLTNNGRSFYLYPTVLGAGATGTTITIHAKLNIDGSDKTYTVMAGADIPIEAGRLYSFGINSTIRFDFPQTGEMHTFIAPYDGLYTLEAWGAQGDSNDNLGEALGSGVGGLGGYSRSERTMKKGTYLYIFVGFGGGGGSYYTAFGYGRGGGGTDFRTGGGPWDGWSLDLRFLVAGGGGGGGFSGNGYPYGHGGHGGPGGGGPTSQGGSGSSGEHYYISPEGSGGEGGRNSGGSATGGAGGAGKIAGGNGGSITGGNGGGVYLLGVGGGGGGGYGGGGGGGKGAYDGPDDETIFDDRYGPGSGGGGGGGGGSYGATAGAPGVNAGAARARVSLRIP